VHPAHPISQVVGDNVAGNDRPTVIRYGGLMIRRCEAIALYATKAGGGERLRQELHAAARARGIAVIDLTAGVLSPATLQSQAPDVVACLPPSTSAATAQRLSAGRLSGEGHHTEESVLIHQLVFSLRPVHTTAKRLAAAIAREGILTDTLGNYRATVDKSTQRLTITYTGQLLSDTEIDGVRDAIARRDHGVGADISVTPLSTAGPAIDLSTEPLPAPATEPTVPHQHH
jgi:hypothetical protein